MTVAPDTNVLLRVIVQDDAKQARAAQKMLNNATTIAISLPCICELVWVLGRGYRFSSDQIIAALESLVDAQHVSVNRPAVESGLASMRLGGDFADAVLAYEGVWLGAESFVTFDKKAAKVLKELNYKAELLA